ncbi:BZ3500_MvSof-1268-A1-R1_Chr1-1g01009 [Microbotryum saponariae]|uniref:BZ3500_MvSof-1268-A1-R1_Chr1-1g01009 protein n=1 Tax=Microbotryum saponariae TaxID=289078 RepID=A0A2X0KMP6_9BASI|nr:BZ3500_MvSof-1268-A1-R1_Chr1-1g01009 [Microbotryum saponariae]SCZ93168.1 BZ3501_MvSof-1269-A2-R1_Chr1-1g00606 [Microbotryum saponariae]
MAPPTPALSNLVHTLSGHKGPVNSAVYNSGASYVLTAGQDRTIKLWNPVKGTLVKTYAGHGYEVLGLDCTHDNSRFASCGGDRSVFVWDVASGELIRRLSGHMAKVNAVAFNQDASILASGSFDSTVRLWDIKYVGSLVELLLLDRSRSKLTLGHHDRSQNRIPLQVLEDARDSITSICIRNHLISVGSVDGHVRTYDLRMGELRADYFDHPVTSISISNDSAMLLVTSLDSTIRNLDLDTGVMFTKYQGHKNESYRSPSSFGKDERTVVMGDEEGKVYTWDVETGKQLGSGFRAHERAILWTAHHPKQDELVTASADATVKIWGGRRG